MIQFKFALLFLVASGALALNLPKGLKALRNIKDDDDDPEMNMSAPEMIQYFGYPVEIHTITTSDGYIIEIHRIPFGLKTSEGPKTPVIIQHGILCSSADYVINFPYQSLGFALADEGYDVWVTNVRGNTYGRGHTTYDADTDDEFWHFSWDQMGEYDMPTIIDYILQATGYSQLYYVGHSMGTTLAFAMLSTKTEYNDKIKTYLAMGPVATLNYVETPIKYLAPFSDEINFLLQLLGTGEFLPSDGVISWFAQDCDASLEILCENILFVLCGYDLEELNTTRMDVYVAHTPAGTSTWAMIHYAQEIDVGRFRHCDWGATENYERYGQDTPPDYDVSLVTVPTALFWGQNDLLADPTDVEILSYSLPNLIGSYQTGDENWAHMDFLWGIDTGTLVNPQLIALMPKF